MIPRLCSSGRSFKGLSQYLSHDPQARSAERVAWTHTLNCANDHVPSAVHEMYSTYTHAELLKQENGVRAGGRQLETPVKHVSLNWHPSERPSHEEMIAAAQSYLEHMGWQEHQAILYAHGEKAYCHLHIMLNAIHPETGLKLDDSFEKRRTQEWALGHEREHGRIFCEQRLLEPDQREPSPTRQTWEALKEAEREHDRAEQARRAYDPDYLGREDNRRIAQSEEWKLLKDHQRQERDAFFVDGRQAFIEIRTSIYRAVREEFREAWGDYFAARREGLAPEQLAEMRADILERQNAMLEERRTEACAALREQRDGEYEALLLAQKEARHELIACQERGLSSPHLLELAGDPPSREPAPGAEGPDLGAERPHSRGAEPDRPSGFLAAADEVCSEAQDRSEPWPFEDGPPEITSAENPRTRDPANAIGDLGMGAIGALATIAERLLDGFLGGARPQENVKPSPPQPGRESPEPRRSNSLAKTAEAAQRSAERQEEELRNRGYWEERERTRERD
jgi:hypothetical protein